MIFFFTRFSNYRSEFIIITIHPFKLHRRECVFIFRLFLFLLFYSFISHAKLISLVAMRQPWKPGINPITPGLMRYQAGPAWSVHSINTTIKNPSRFDYVGVSNRRWQDRSSMRYIGIASEQRVPRVSSGPNLLPLYRSHRQSASASAGNWRLNRKRKRGKLSPLDQTKATR